MSDINKPDGEELSEDALESVQGGQAWKDFVITPTDPPFDPPTTDPPPFDPLGPIIFDGV
jgi:hypothetical protein